MSAKTTEDSLTRYLTNIMNLGWPHESRLDSFWYSSNMLAELANKHTKKITSVSAWIPGIITDYYPGLVGNLSRRNIDTVQLFRFYCCFWDGIGPPINGDIVGARDIIKKVTQVWANTPMGFQALERLAPKVDIFDIYPREDILCFAAIYKGFSIQKMTGTWPLGINANARDVANKLQCDYLDVAWSA